MRRKKKKFGYRLYAFFAFAFFVADLILLLLLIFHVQRIEVVGNEGMQDVEIVSWIKEDEYTSNSIYAVWKYHNYKGDIPENLNSVKVQMKLPWVLRVTVEEKKPVAAILEGDTYICFDREGLILEQCAELPEDLSVIEGLTAGNAQVYEQIKAEDVNAFTYVDELLQALTRYELMPERIVWEDDGLSAFYGDVQVKFGKSSFDKKALQLTAILGELEGKSGILHLEHYSETNQSISFEKNS